MERVRAMDELAQQHSARILLQLQEQVNETLQAPRGFIVYDQWSVSLVHRLAVDNQIGLLKQILDHGVDVNLRDRVEDTPLIDAVAEGSSDEMVAFLIANGANVNAQNHHGFSALHRAASRNNVVVAQMLIVAGAEVDIMTEDGITPLLIAANDGHTEITRKLIHEGANVNHRDKRTKLGAFLSLNYEKVNTSAYHILSPWVEKRFRVMHEIAPLLLFGGYRPDAAELCWYCLCGPEPQYLLLGLRNTKATYEDITIKFTMQHHVFYEMVQRHAYYDIFQPRFIMVAMMCPFWKKQKGCLYS